MNARINHDQSVASILKSYPQTIPVFLRHHMSCVGCSMNAFETLGDACSIYGLDLVHFLAELRQATGADMGSVQPF